MATLEIETGKNNTAEPAGVPTKSVEKSADTAVLITEQQVLFASTAALVPSPAGRRNIAHDLVASVRTMFCGRPEKPRSRKHYPQRFGYLESSAMSREMNRL